MISMTRLFIATRNAHKVGEIQAILGNGYSYQTLRDFPGAPEIVEDANTFAGNATKKAQELAHWLGSMDSLKSNRSSEFVLADDSGLEVDALHGAPGVHSARFAALENGARGNAADAANNAKLLQLLQYIPTSKRTARFRCVIALVAVEQREARPPWLFDGTCEGRIGFAPRGHGGFGYDPLFVPTGFEISFAELGEATKNQMSHRAQALERLKAHLTQLPRSAF